jgi:hypothetical protein
MKKLFLILLTLIPLLGFSQVSDASLSSQSTYEILNKTYAPNRANAFNQDMINNKVSYTGGITASGTNTYTATLQNFSSVPTNLSFDVTFTNANSASSTLNLGTGAITLKKFSSGSLANLASGDISAGQTFRLRYNGTFFVIIGSTGSGSAGLYWPLSGSETLTGNVSIDGDGNSFLLSNASGIQLSSTTDATISADPTTGVVFINGLSAEIETSSVNFITGKITGGLNNNNTHTGANAFQFGESNSIAASFGAAQFGESGITTSGGNASFMSGESNYITAYGATAQGRGVAVTGTYSWGGGWYSPSGLSGSTNTKAPLVSGNGSFGFFETDASQTAGHGVLANSSAVLGGTNPNIPATSPGSVIIGGTGIKARASDPYQVYVPNLNINTAPANDNALTDVLVRDGTTGLVKYKTVASFGSGAGTVTVVTGTSPIVITSTATTTPNVTIGNAAADGSTKGAAAFTANDFDASSGVISIDYTNGQASATGAKGFLTSTDWNTFNGKQSAITFGTGVQTALGVNIGSAGAPVLFNGAYGTPVSLTGTNISGTAAGLTAGTVTTNANLTGDVTSSGNATTLATVNSNVGSFGSSTAIPVVAFNGKGLATSVSTAAVVAPAGTLTGTTLASNIVTSSLTSVGTLGGLTVTSAPTFSAMTLGSSLFGGTSGLLSQDNSNYFYDATNHRLGLGTTGPLSRLTVTNQSSYQAPVTGSLAQFIGTDANPLRLTFDTHNNASASGTAFMVRRSRGTAGTPLALQTDDVIAAFSGRGFGATQYAAASTGLINIKANQAFTDANNGTYISFDATPDNSVTAAEAFRITGAKTLIAPGYTTNGGLLYTNGSGLITQSGAGTSATVLHGGTTPSYSAVSLTSDVSGILPIANGGTGSSSGLSWLLASGGTLTGTNTITQGANPINYTYTSTSGTVIPTTYTNSITATANGQALTSIDLNTTYANSGFTGTSNVAMRLRSGRVGINIGASTIDAGLKVVGEGATSATTCVSFNNSGGNIAELLNDGLWRIGNAGSRPQIGAGTFSTGVSSNGGSSLYFSSIAGFIFNNTSDGQGIKLSGLSTAASGAVIRNLYVSTSYNFTGGTNTTTGFDYDPSYTGTTGLTKYGVVVRPSDSFSGYGLGASQPTATLHVQGTVKLDGSVTLPTAGNGILIKEGTNATMGVATLVAGTVTVSTNKVTANSRIFLTGQNLGTITVPVGYAVSARTGGTSFTILSANALDTSAVAWQIIEPAP